MQDKNLNDQKSKFNIMWMMIQRQKIIVFVLKSLHEWLNPLNVYTSQLMHSSYFLKQQQLLF